MIKFQLSKRERAALQLINRRLAAALCIECGKPLIDQDKFPRCHGCGRVAYFSAAEWRQKGRLPHTPLTRCKPVL